MSSLRWRLALAFALLAAAVAAVVGVVVYEVTAERPPLPRRGRRRSPRCRRPH